MQAMKTQMSLTPLALDPLANPTFESFQLADGITLSWGELLARGFDIDGTEGNDVMIGTGVDDRMDAKGGNDLILGLTGNDTITGGTGTDGMNGGLGDDTYVFIAGYRSSRRFGAVNTEWRVAA